MPQTNSPPPTDGTSPQSNWPFLLIAILMAVVLWLFVRTGNHALAQRTLFAPIEMANADQGLHVSPSRVEVRLEGPGNLVHQMVPNELSVTADLTGHTEGDLIPLSVVPPQGLKVLGTSVSQVRVVRQASGPP
ncbi:MAG: hypothetical protein VKP62_05080 [Candidatus Sericytochromatia bacterium]|nr:hypothetical protein [Candidatus Sericytochromatia bacterium]